MCDITVYIGDNASGKTRKSIEKALGHKFIRGNKERDLITNIPYIITDKIPNKEKREIIRESDFSDILRTVTRRTGFNHDIAEAERLLYLLELEGKVLLLDEIDSKLNEGYVANYLNTVYENRHLWDRVVVNGHSPYISRVFGDGPTNIILVDKYGNEKHIGESEMYEYFDSI